MKFIKLKLFSHIKVKGEAPYESVISRFENASVRDSRLPPCKQEASLRAATRKRAQALCWDSCDDERFFTEREKKKYKAEIYNNACEALLPVVIPQIFERCIYSAVPSVLLLSHSIWISLAMTCRIFPTTNASSFSLFTSFCEVSLI